MGCQSRTRSRADRLGVSIRGCLRKPWGSWATGAPFTDLGIDKPGAARHGRLEAVRGRGCGGSRVPPNSIECRGHTHTVGAALGWSTWCSGDPACGRLVGELDEYVIRDELVERGALARLPDLDTVRGRRYVQEVAGPQARRIEPAHQLGVGLHLLADAVYSHDRVGVRGGRGEGEQATCGVGRSERQAELLETRDRVAVRAHERLVEERDDAPLYGVAHDVFPAARFDVQVLPVQTDHVGQQPFGEPMLTHHRGGLSPARCRELEMAVIGDVQESVALHAGDRLAYGGATLAQALGDTCPQRDDAFLLEFVHGPQVHLGRVDEVAVVAHWPNLRLRWLQPC